MKKRIDKEKTKKVKKPKKKLTYVEAHNRAFRAYTKSAGIMLWASIFNVFGVILPIIQYAISPNPSSLFTTNSYFGLKLGYSPYQFGFSFSIQSIICRFLEVAVHGIGGDITHILPTYAFYIISIVSSVVFAGLIAYFSVLARNGKKWALMFNSIFYAIDSLLIIVCYLLGEDMQNIWILFGIHVIILAFVFISIFEYYHLFAIEKVAKDQQEKDKNQIKQEYLEKRRKKLEKSVNDVFNNEEKKIEEPKIEEPQNPLFNVIIKDEPRQMKEDKKNGTK